MSILFINRLHPRDDIAKAKSLLYLSSDSIDTLVTNGKCKPYDRSYPADPNNQPSFQGIPPFSKQFDENDLVCEWRIPAIWVHFGSKLQPDQIQNTPPVVCKGF